MPLWLAAPGGLHKFRPKLQWSSGKVCVWTRFVINAIDYIPVMYPYRQPQRVNAQLPTASRRYQYLVCTYRRHHEYQHI